jgi:hypothetical protein
MDIGARPIVMQMSVLVSRPYRYRISADSYADLRVGSAGIHIGAPPESHVCVLGSDRLDIVLKLRSYRYWSSAYSYADERVVLMTV